MRLNLAVMALFNLQEPCVNPRAGFTGIPSLFTLKMLRFTRRYER